MSEIMPLVFERSVPGRVGFSLPEQDVPETDLSQIFDKKNDSFEKSRLT